MVKKEPNIIFDIGQVLLQYQPIKNLKKALRDEAKAKDIFSKTFGSQDWLKLDRGHITRQELIAKLTAKYPEDKEIIRTAIKDWPRYLEPITANKKVLLALKEQDYPLYYLSNFPKEGFEESQELFPFLKNFAAGLISAEVGHIKPEKEIYEAFLAKVNIDPARTIFIDDSKENTKAAADLGWQTIHFNKETDLQQEFKQLGLL